MSQQFFRPLCVVGPLALICCSLPGSVEAEAASRRVKWECSCLTYSGSRESCHMYATVSGRTFEFGAFETSGAGNYIVKRAANETVVTGRIRTHTGGRLTAIIVTPRGGATSYVHIGTRRRGQQTFTARCRGRL